MRPYLGPTWTNSRKILYVRVFHCILLKYGHENVAMQKQKIDDATLRYSIGLKFNTCNSTFGYSESRTYWLQLQFSLHESINSWIISKLYSCSLITVDCVWDDILHAAVPCIVTFYYTCASLLSHHQALNYAQCRFHKMHRFLLTCWGEQE